MLDQGGWCRPLFELLAFTGLRVGEALGLTWADVTFDDGRLKTEAGRRQIVLAPGDGPSPPIPVARELVQSSG